MNTPKEIDSSNEIKEKLEDLKIRFTKFIKNIPLFLKCYFIITIILYFLNLIFSSISFYLINHASYTLLKFQIWRLITSVFITTNIIPIILAFLLWVKYATLLEMSLGTIKYTLIFFINSICIQILNIIFYSFFSLFSKSMFNSEKKLKNNCGLWGILMCEMTLLCVNNPESPMKLLFLPYTVKAKIYPLVLIVIFFISNFFKLDVEIISGAIYGLIYYYFLKSRLQISDTFVQNLEISSFFKWLSGVSGFISVTHISSGMPISISKMGNIDNEQEKEKLKGKKVIVAGSLDTKKDNKGNDSIETNKINVDNEAQV